MSCSFIFTNEKEGPYQLLCRSQPADCIAPFPHTPFPTFGAGRERHHYHLLLASDQPTTAHYCSPASKMGRTWGRDSTEFFCYPAIPFTLFLSHSNVTIYIWKTHTEQPPTLLSFTPCPSSGSSAPPNILCSVFWPCLLPGQPYSKPFPPALPVEPRSFPLTQPTPLSTFLQTSRPSPKHCCRQTPRFPSPLSHLCEDVTDWGRVAVDSKGSPRPFLSLSLWGGQHHCQGDVSRPMGECSAASSSPLVFSSQQDKLEEEAEQELAQNTSPQGKLQSNSFKFPYTNIYLFPHHCHHTLCQSPHQPLHFGTTLVRALSFYSQEA